MFYAICSKVSLRTDRWYQGLSNFKTLKSYLSWAISTYIKHLINVGKGKKYLKNENKILQRFL